MERAYYRIIRGEIATLDDFKSAQALGKPLRDPAWEREWATGVSVFDTLPYAMERARAVRFLLGRYVVAMRLPIDTTIEVRQTGKDQHHFTVYGSPEQLLGLVVGEAVLVEE